MADVEFEVLGKATKILRDRADGKHQESVQASGITRLTQYQLAVQAAAYAPGHCIGGKITLSNFAEFAGGSGIITRLELRSLQAVAVQSFLHLFSADPAASTLTDNAALAIHADDRLKRIDTLTIDIADWISNKGASADYFAALVDPANGRPLIPYQLESGNAALFAAIEAAGSLTPGTTADFALVAGRENN